MKINYFTVYRSIAIPFNIALRINSQSELTLICDWSEMNKLQFSCCQLFLQLAENVRWPQLSLLQCNWSRGGAVSNKVITGRQA